MPTKSEKSSKLMLTLLWQINESFKKFGILDNTSNVLLVMITQEDAVEKVGVVIAFNNTFACYGIYCTNRTLNRLCIVTGS